MKKIVTIIIIVLVCVGVGYWLFKLSPSDTAINSASGSYNASLDISNAKAISAVPAFNPETDRYVGNKDAKNVFVEYADYQCPACATYSELLKEVNTVFPDTVFVFRYFPLVQIHPNSVESAVAAEAAGAQGKYWEMHDILFQKQKEWESVNNPLDKFAEYAQQVGVANIEQFKSDVSSKKYLPAVQKNSDEALGLNLPGTPSFFFNGHSIKNNTVELMKKEAEQWIVK